MRRQLSPWSRRLSSIVVLALACVPRLAAADQPLRVGNLVPTSFSFLPLQIGIEKGLFKKHGLDVTRIDFPRGAASGHQALAAGSVDMVAGGGVEMGFIMKGAPEVAALKTKQTDAGVIDLATAFQLEATADARILLKFGDIIDTFVNQASFAST